MSEDLQSTNSDFNLDLNNAIPGISHVRLPYYLRDL